MIRAVLDTNVSVSAVSTPRGVNAQVLDLITASLCPLMKKTTGSTKVLQPQRRIIQ